jgi:hypothetical protein
MRHINRKLLLSAAAIVVGIATAAVTARALGPTSSSYILRTSPFSGSYGGGTTASASYQLAISWGGMSGRVKQGNVIACLGILCDMTGNRIFAPTTFNQFSN